MKVITKVFLASCLASCMGCATIPQEYEASFKTATRIRKVAEEGDNDFWQTPKETRIVNQGDCEDITFLLEEELIKKGLEPKVCFGRIKKYDTYQHMWIEIDKNGTNYVLDPAINHFEIKTDGRYIKETGGINAIYMLVLEEYRKTIRNEVYNK